MSKAMCEQADGSSKVGASSRKARAHKFLKSYKNRVERRRAKIDPECPPYYGKYRGWET